MPVADIVDVPCASGLQRQEAERGQILDRAAGLLEARADELVRALQLEAHFGKDELLAMYLTLAPYGGNLEGLRAASLAWFGKEPRELAASGEYPEILGPLAEGDYERALAALRRLLEVGD